MPPKVIASPLKNPFQNLRIEEERARAVMAVLDRGTVGLIEDVQAALRASRQR